MKTLKFSQFIPAILFFLFTFYLFTLPGKEIPKLPWAEKIQFDKIVHMGLFLTLIGSFAFPFNKSNILVKHRNYWFLLFAIIGIAYGISVEFIQKYFIANRTFDLYDIAADAVGCIIGYLISTYLFKK